MTPGHKSYSSLFQALRDWGVEYAAGGRVVLARVIHGDPVFSNAILSTLGTVVWIDMRGRVGSTLTLAGDVLYDLAKVYQSLHGYDFILHGVDMGAVDELHREELSGVFDEFVRRQYPTVRMSDVCAAAALLFFSLVPLHQDRGHQKRFLHCSAALLAQSRERLKEEAAATAKS